MSLILCPECNREVSDTAPSCPHCGYTLRPQVKSLPVKKKFSIMRVLRAVTIFFLIVIGAVIAWRYVGKTVELTGESPNDPISNVVRAEKKLFDNSETVKEDQYLTLSFRLKRDAAVSIRTRVVSGPNVDLFLLNEGNMEAFKKYAKGNRGTEIKYLVALSSSNTRDFTKSANLRSGQYYYVIDNTNFGSAKPPSNFQSDNAVVEYRITAR
jgi:hypothetical protein